jgi:predicted glycoside hydrolase/deacetylase ChbG (UPF0249 family)
MPDRILIINADDLGYDPAVTQGILEAIRGGVVSSTTLIVNSPHAKQAAASAAGIAVGLHLNLARFAPVWRGFPESCLVDGELSESLASQLPAEVVEQETLAQLDRLEELIGRPATHVDVHKHLHRSPRVLDGLCSAAVARKLPVRSIDEAMRRALRERGLVTPDGFIGEAAREPYWTMSRLRLAIETLPDGVTELMCHPGYSPVAVPSAYSLQREVELQTFIHPSAAALLRRGKVKVADFTVLRD